MALPRQPLYSIHVTTTVQTIRPEFQLSTKICFVLQDFSRTSNFMLGVSHYSSRCSTWVAEPTGKTCFLRLSSKKGDEMSLDGVTEAMVYSIELTTATRTIREGFWWFSTFGKSFLSRSHCDYFMLGVSPYSSRSSQGKPVLHFIVRTLVSSLAARWRCHSVIEKRTFEKGVLI